MRPIFISIFLFLLCNVAFNQIEIDTLDKNQIGLRAYASIGGVPESEVLKGFKSYHLYLEKRLWRNEYLEIYLRGGYGLIIEDDSKTTRAYLLQPGFLYGKKNKLDFTAGMGYYSGDTFINYETDEDAFRFSGAIAYRVTLLQDFLLLRLGIGWWEMIFLSFGVNL